MYMCIYHARKSLESTKNFHNCVYTHLYLSQINTMESNVKNDKREIEKKRTNERMKKNQRKKEIINKAVLCPTMMMIQSDWIGSTSFVTHCGQ